LVDEQETPAQRAAFGLYLRSVEFGIYVNVRGQDVGSEPRTREGMLAVLHDQTWASTAFDEWTDEHAERGLVAVGGTFEMTSDRSGEVVLEAFVTDGHFVANLATPGDRNIIAAATPEIMRLARTISFE
jgi:hypothetical protein